MQKAFAGSDVPVPEMLAYCGDEAVLGRAVSPELARGPFVVLQLADAARVVVAVWENRF